MGLPSREKMAMRLGISAWGNREIVHREKVTSALGIADREAVGW